MLVAFNLGVQMPQKSSDLKTSDFLGLMETEVETKGCAITPKIGVPEVTSKAPTRHVTHGSPCSTVLRLSKSRQSEKFENHSFSAMKENM